MAKLLVTPVGEAVFPYLRRPDNYQGDESYKVNIRVHPDNDDVQAYITKMEKFRDEQWDNNPQATKLSKAQRAKLSAHPVVREELDAEGEPTGFVLIPVKCKKEYVDRETSKAVSLKPTVVDAKKQPIPDTIDVGPGSSIKAAFSPFFWVNPSIKAYGVTARLKAVQVLELKERGLGGVFDDEEGFEIDESAIHEPTDEDVRAAVMVGHESSYPNAAEETDDF